MQCAIISASLVAASLLCSCGGKGDERPKPAAHAVVFQEAAAGRMVVAEVNGTPVYDDCVTRQLRAGAANPTAALDECVDFELLAQEAQRRGLAAHPAVLETRKREVVRVFIASQFTKSFAGPEDVPESDLRLVYKRIRGRYDHDEYRTAVYARAEVDKKAPRQGPADLAAKTLASDVYRALRNKRNLTPDEFKSIALTTAEPRTLSMGMRPFSFPRRGRAVKEYADAAFAIPEVGRVSVPTRTQWGWDIILLTKIMPEVHRSYADVKGELAKEIFDESRRQAFLRWSHTLSKGKKIDIDEDVFAKLERPVWMTGAQPPPKTR